MDIGKIKDSIIIDGDLGENKIEHLLSLKFEEEKLDYKSYSQLTSNYEEKEFKVNLVCDIVAMANTFGGYLILGVEDGSFDLKGVDEKILKLFAEEKVQNYIHSCIETNISIKLKSTKISEKDVICICISKHSIPIPFKKQGAYKNSSGKDIIKFKKGEIFVRHGSISERANYSDMLNFMERIRMEERQKVRNQEDRLGSFNLQLNEIIRLLGGNPSENIFKPDLFSGSDEQIEYKTLKVDTVLMPFFFKRAFMNKFQEIERDARHILKVKGLEVKIELSNTKFKDELLKIIPIWTAAVRKNDLDIGRNLTRRIFVLLNGLAMADDTYNKDCKSDEESGIDSLYFIEQIIYLIYNLGAIAIWSKRLNFAKLLVNQKAEFHHTYYDSSWFRYAFTMLSRNKRLEEDFITKATNFGLVSSYLKNLVEVDVFLRIYIGQFDYYQCLNVLLDKSIDNDFYPNYMFLGKAKQIEPFVELIIENYHNSDNLFSNDKQEVKNSILKLDSKQLTEWAQIKGSAWYYRWGSTKINEFLDND